MLKEMTRQKREQRRDRAKQKAKKKNHPQKTSASYKINECKNQSTNVIKKK